MKSKMQSTDCKSRTKNRIHIILNKGNAFNCLCKYNYYIFNESHLHFPSLLRLSYQRNLFRKRINCIMKSTGVNYAFHGPYSFVGSAGTNTAEVQLNFDNFNYVSSLVMYVKKTNTPPTLTEMDFDNYEHKNPTSSSSYDLQNANSGQRQIVSVGGLVPGDNIYIFVVNLISRANAQYKINVTERIGPNPAYCASGNPQALGSIYCINCNNNLTYGAFCDISTTVLPGNMIYSPVIPAWNDVKPNFATITIPTSSSTINLYYTSSITAVLVLVQFKYFSSEVAGLVNFASGGFKLVNQTVTQFTVPINSGGTNDISVSFINLNVNPANLQVWY